MALLTSCCFAAFKIDDPFSALIKKLEAYHQGHPQEKVHLHLDKPYYAAGDDIWFKAYVINTLNSSPTDISNILYVELIDETGSIKKQVKLLLFKGFASGDFKLTDSLTEGNYRIRAYTQWMRNTGPAFFFDKTLKIGSRLKASGRPSIVADSSVTDVQFFPEGGNLVEDIPSRLGIKAVNSHGLGMNISGTIIDDQGIEVRPFSTTYMGMGNVILDPKPGKNYTAVVQFEDGSTKKIRLPKALPVGYVLAVNGMDSTKINVKIYLSKSAIGKGDLKLLAQNNGNVYAAFTVQTDKPLAVVNIPKRELPIGILQLTLFGPDRTPVCERLTFINNPADITALRLLSNKKEYQKREQIDLTLFSGTDSKPIQGNFSLSVTNTSVVQPDEENESNILATFLLTSDLAGYVEKPNYYFQKTNQVTQSNLDNLLLTQGWRRFSWKDLETTSATAYPCEKSIAIGGILTTSGGKPVNKAGVSLFSNTNGIFVADTLTNAGGYFNFDQLTFPDGTKFVIQGKDPSHKTNIKLKLDIAPRQIVTPNKNTGDIKADVNKAISSYLAKSGPYFEKLSKRNLPGSSISLKEVNVNQRKPLKYSTNLNGAGHANQVITASQLKSGETLSSNLMAFIPGIVFPSGQPALTRYAVQKKMHILVDGVNRELVGETIDNFMNIEDIESIEVLKSLSYTAIYGAMGDGGVLLITTKRGHKRKSDPRSIDIPGIITCTPKGYDIPREFYSPKYTPESSSQPDLRTTVYWNPQIITNPSGTAKVSYFNTDQSGTYRVVVEGMNASGQLARTVYTYEVK